MYDLGKMWSQLWTSNSWLLSPKHTTNYLQESVDCCFFPWHTNIKYLKTCLGGLRGWITLHQRYLLNQSTIPYSLTNKPSYRHPLNQLIGNSDVGWAFFSFFALVLSRSTINLHEKTLRRKSRRACSEWGRFPFNFFKYFNSTFHVQSLTGPMISY